MASFTRGGLLALLLPLSAAVTASGGCSGSDGGGGQFIPLTDAAADGPGGGATGDATSGAGGGSMGGAGSGGTPSGGAGGGTAGGANGAGGAAPVACTSDAACTAADGRCDATRGVCVACLFDNECGISEHCETGVCTPLTECTNSRDCRDAGGPRTICDIATQRCVECSADADCGSGRVCAIDTCVDSSTCSSASEGGVPCKTGEVCSPAGKCVGCVDDQDCATNEKCLADACKTPCSSDNDCVAGNQLCDTAAGACVDCNQDSDCDALEHCASGACEADVCAQGVTSCAGNSIVECTANGDGILAPVACDAGEECVKDSRSTAVCRVPPPPEGGTPPPANCTDGTKNGDETDVDCGGACANCDDGKGCVDPADCTSNVCRASCTGLLCFPGTRDEICRPAACTDGVKNGTETDVDCGGDSCSRCAVGSTCTANADCEADICASGSCVAAQCKASLCASCFLPTEAPCCKASGLCGCANVFPLLGPCQ